MKKVIFTCIVEGSYKEFTLDETNKNEVEERLKKEEFYTKKYESALSLKEQSNIKEKLQVISYLFKVIDQKDNTSIHLTNLSKDKTILFYTKELLSILKLEPTFTLEEQYIQSYLEGLNKISYQRPEKEIEVRHHFDLFQDSIDNAKALEEVGLTMKKENDTYALENTYKTLEYAKTRMVS